MIKKLSMIKSSKNKLYVYYTILFLVVGLFTFSQLLLNHKTFIWDTDGYLQWYPLLVKFKNVVLNFGEGACKLWSWDTGLGADLIGNYALILFDPFNYIAIFFPDSHMDIAYSVIIILKLYVAGFVMLGFLRYLGKRDWTCLLCSIGYAFCTWGLICLRHEFFLNPLILFPLLVWGVIRVDDKKSPLMLILSVAASVMTSLYFSYMSAIFIVFFVVLKYVIANGSKSVRGFTIHICRYIVYAVTGGVLLTAPILIPTLHTLLQSSTGSGVDVQIVPTLKQLLRFLPAFAGRIDISYNDSIPCMNILLVLMIPAMLLLWKRKKISIYMFSLSAIFAILPLAQSILNGGSYSSGRWGYALVFFFVYAASDCMESDVLLTSKYKNSVMIWICLLLITSLTASLLKAISMIELVTVLLNLCIGSLILFTLFTNPSKNTVFQKRIVWMTLANIVLLPFLSYWPTMGNGLGIYMTQGACFKTYEQSALRTASSIKDDTFYRIDTVDSKGNNGSAIREAHTPANATLYWQVPSLSEYLSTTDKNWIKFNQQLGNSAGSFRRMCVYSNDNRSRLDFLLGIRYFLANDNETGKKQSEYSGYGFVKKDEIDGIQLLEAPYKTGLGYVLDKTMSESDFLKYSELEREQILMQYAVINTDDIKSNSYKNGQPASMQTESIPVSISTGDGQPLSNHSVAIRSNGTKLKIKPDRQIKNSEVFVVFRNFQKKRLNTEQLWQFEQESGTKAGTNSRLQFFCDHLSYIPYENFSIYISNTANQVVKRMINAAGEPQGIRGNKNYIVNLGYFDSFDGEILCNFGTIGNYTFDSIDVVAVPIASYQQQAQTLSRNRLEITSNEGDHLKGTVNAEKDGILFMSILYNPGWDVYIDGTPADTFRVDTAFTGVQVAAGRHDVELIYYPVGYPYSFLLFALGLALTAGCIVYFRKKGQGGNN